MTSHPPAPHSFRAVALLDRDGTLMEDTGYPRDPAAVSLLPRAAAAVRLLNDEGIACVITSNQSGVARGILNRDAAAAVHHRFLELLAAEGARIDASYFCFSGPDDGDEWRKPWPGMYRDASRDLGLSGLPVFAIGDKPTDVEFGINCGGRGIQVMTGKGADPESRATNAATFATDAHEAAEFLLADLILAAKPGDAPLRRKLRPLGQLGREVAAAKSRGQRVVLANGCFDLLHGGHVSYLEDARAQGDLLVLAVNSNHSIRRLKGAGRPVLGEADRLQLLAALQCVDFLTVFYTATADPVLRALRPSVHAKGTDYTSETVPERETARELGIDVAIAGAAKENSSRDIISVVIERARAGLL